MDLHYTPEQASELVLGAVAPLGAEYVATLRHGLASGWTDWMPTTGKQSGAYSEAVYGVHPYQLLNFTGLYEEVSTLAHESGHSMHSWLSDRHQPYVTREYKTFVAEVASTLNENLLLHYMLGRTKDRDTRLFLLGSRLDDMRQTLFRQVLFAEYELKINELAEQGEPLTGEKLSALYLALLREYYGHDQGVCRVDELYGVEWAYIQHFYLNFYMYQYATSILGSTSIAAEMRAEAALRKPVDAAARRLPGHALGRLLEGPDRPAARGRRGHDHLGAVHRRDEGDERDHGRDGEAAGREARQVAAATPPTTKPAGATRRASSSRRRAQRGPRSVRLISQTIPRRGSSAGMRRGSAMSSSCRMSTSRPPPCSWT